jgi:phospholipid/cholesterol/gamma-HCH transport system substrate-binding protein
VPVISLVRRRRVAAGVAGALLLLLAAGVVVGSMSGLISLTQTTYQGEFADAIGLSPGDEVRIAGIGVGQVRSVELQGTKVAVAFTVDNENRLGRDTTLHIKIASILGQQYLEVLPAGPGRLSGQDTIPLARTTTPSTLLGVLGQLSTNTDQIDLAQLQAAMQTLSDSFRGTPSSTGPLLKGLSQLTQTLAGHSRQLTTLLNSSQGVTATLAARQGQLVALLGDSDLVLKTLQDRRQVIHQLLLDVQGLSSQLASLIAQDKAQLQPLLAGLQSVSAVLARNQDALDAGMQDLAPFSRYVANATGSGKWVDLFVPTIVVPDNVLVQCNKAGATKAVTGCTP